MKNFKLVSVLLMLSCTSRTYSHSENLDTQTHTDFKAARKAKAIETIRKAKEDVSLNLKPFLEAVDSSPSETSIKKAEKKFREYSDFLKYQQRESVFKTLDAQQVAQQNACHDTSIRELWKALSYRQLDLSDTQKLLQEDKSYKRCKDVFYIIEHEEERRDILRKQREINFKVVCALEELLDVEKLSYAELMQGVKVAEAFVQLNTGK